MPFKKSNLDPSASGSTGLACGLYKTSDTLADIEAAGYFDEAWGLMRGVASVLVIANDNAREYAVTSLNGSVSLRAITATAEEGALAQRAFQIITPKMVGAQGFPADDTMALDLAKSIATLLKVPLGIDGEYRRVGQWFFNAPCRIIPVVQGASVQCDMTSEAASFLVLTSDFRIEEGIHVYRNLNQALPTAYGTIFTVGRTAYPVVPTEPIERIHIGCSMSRNANDYGNNVSVSGWVDDVEVPADIEGTHMPTPNPMKLEGCGVVIHWGAFGTLSVIDGYSYHPTNVKLTGLRVRGAGAAVKLSSCSNVRGHFTAHDCEHVLSILPGDNAADAALPEQKPNVGADIDVSFHATDCGNDKIVYITSLGHMLIPDTWHGLEYKNLRVRGYARLKTQGVVDGQIIDIENVIGTPAPDIEIRVENCGPGTGFALDRVGDVKLNRCSSDSTVAPFLVVRCRNVDIVEPRCRKPRDTTVGTIPATFGVRILGEKRAAALAANMAVGATSITIDTPFMQRCVPGDAISITTGGAVRTVYASAFTDTGALVIPIEPAGFAATAADVAVLRTDINNVNVIGGTIRGYRYAVASNLGSNGADLAATFESDGINIVGVKTREIAERDYYMLRSYNGSIIGNRQADCGIGRILNAGLTPRMIYLDTCENMFVDKNFCNPDKSPNMAYFLVATASSKFNSITENRIGATAVAAFSKGASAADSQYRDNKYTDGTAAP